MEKVVKADIGRRARKALATRSRALDAAEELFVRDGFAATTIIAIADEADLAVQTIYAVFGNKRAILNDLIAARIVGDDLSTAQQFPARVRGRAEWMAIEKEADPHRQVALLAEFATQIGNRIAALYQVLAGAAGSDPEIAELYRNQQQARYKDQLRLARSLSRKGVLKEGLTEAAATDIMWAVANPNTHHALIGQRHWTPDQYQRWLAHVLTSSLLANPDPDPGDSGARSS